MPQTPFPSGNFVCNLEEMQILATKIASFLEKRNIILLNGELGAGKTTFSKFIINAISNSHNVISPTFNIVQQYESPKGKIWHYDLYRLKLKEELEEIGLEEAMEDIVIIEWPQIAAAYLPSDTININITFLDDNKRSIAISVREVIDK